jgi:tRNA G18 (ribose-2'-O)-methylase SpoU
MIHVQAIDSLDLPGLEPYRTMRQQYDHRQQQIFVAEGEKVVRRLLESHFPVVSLLLPEKWLRNFEPLLRNRPEEIHVYVAEKQKLEQLTGFTMYQGVMAVGKVPVPTPLEVILQTSPQPYLFVAVDGVNNAQNLGVLARNCAAFGVQALLVGETSSSPFLRRAVRSSMGAIFQLPVVELTSLADTLHQLRNLNVHCIAAHPHACQRKPSQTDLAAACCLVFGNEGYGLASAVIEACAHVVAIPMQGQVDSLNVGSAAAVLLYEANRQRHKM